MKSQVKKRIVIGLLISFLVCATLTSELTVEVLHIIAGVALLPLVAIHVALSRKYFAYIAKNFLKKPRPINRLIFISDVLLISLLISLSVLGIAIAVGDAETVFGSRDNMVTVHGVLAHVMVLLAIAHALFHVLGARKKRKHEEPSVRKEKLRG